MTEETPDYSKYESATKDLFAQLDKHPSGLEGVLTQSHTKHTSRDIAEGETKGTGYGAVMFDAASDYLAKEMFNLEDGADRSMVNSFLESVIGASRENFNRKYAKKKDITRQELSNFANTIIRSADGLIKSRNREKFRVLDDADTFTEYLKAKVVSELGIEVPDVLYGSLDDAIVLYDTLIPRLKALKEEQKGAQNDIDELAQ